MWLVLLLPSWLPALGWERLVQPDGVMYRIGLDWPWVTHLIMGPFGVVLLLGLRCVPFTLPGHHRRPGGPGAGVRGRRPGARRDARGQALRLIIPILAPAIWSALAIGFAESISDFGVAATLAYNSNFPLATYQLYAAIGNFPPSFPLAAGDGLAAGRGGGGPAGAAGAGAARPVLRDPVRPDPAGGAAAAVAAATVAGSAGVALFFAGGPRHPGRSAR